MGWDVVQIGLKHNLPVDDPQATTQEIAKRFNQNVRLVYRNEYQYDIENNVIAPTEETTYVEIGRFEVKDSEAYIPLIACNYQEHQILNKGGYERLKEATFIDDDSELFWDAINKPSPLYDIECEELDIRIYQENVDLNVCIIERWSTWEFAFHTSSYEYKEWLQNYRTRILEKAKLFGCEEVIICSDQGPTQEIYCRMHYSAEQLKKYVTSKDYFDDYHPCFPSDADPTKENAKHINFSSYIQGTLNLSKDDSIVVILDDVNESFQPAPPQESTPPEPHPYTISGVEFDEMGFPICRQ